MKFKTLILSVMVMISNNIFAQMSYAPIADSEIFYLQENSTIKPRFANDLKSNKINPNIDSDGDSILDKDDVDDDNDGILDINEECKGFLAQNQNGTWLGKTTSGLSVSAPSMTTQTAVSNLNDGQINYWVNQNGGLSRISRQSASSHSITYTFSTPVPAYEIAFLIFDVDPSIGMGSLNVEYTFLVNGIPSNDFVSVSRGNSLPTLVYNPSTGKINLSSTVNDHEILLKGIANTLVSTITLTSINTGGGDNIGYSLFAYAQCDTDGDGTQNQLDLDSDGDNCPDVIEGGANFQIGAPYITSDRLNTTVNSLGVPSIPSSTTGYTDLAGQITGHSQDSTRNDCILPFTCNNLAYQVSRPTAGNSSLYSYDVSLGILNLISPLGFRANAIGYSTIDNTLWGYNSNDKKVVRIGTNGSSANYTIPNLPTGFDFNVGTVSPDGYLFLYYSGNTRYYVVDISPLRSTYLQLVDPSTSFSLETTNFGTTLSSSIQVSDWAYNSNNGLLYGIIDPAHTNALKIVTINPISGIVSFSSTQVSGAGVELETTGYGSIFTDANFQSLYIFASTLGSFFKIDITTNIATLLSTPGSTINNDGANCPTTNLITYCYKPATLDTGNTFPTKHGITALGRAGVENENWPMTRQSAWTVLESKEKGFVVNRVATTAGLENITNPVEGMMVYDGEADCLKIYTLKSGDSIMGWHCFTTPACPD